MATNREGPLKVNLIHGAKSHPILLSLALNDKNTYLAVEHLASEAERITGIPRNKQKLIFKGKTINQSGPGELLGTVSLRSLGIKDGTKIMLLGSKPSEKIAEGMPLLDSSANCDNEGMSQCTDDISKLQSFESSLEKESSNLGCLFQELESIKERLTGMGNERELQQLQTKLMLSVEGFMRLLESLDDLRFDSDDFISRSKRKKMVDKIQTMMDQCEELTSSIQQMLSRNKR